VSVAKGVDELMWAQIADLCDHMRKQTVRGDVKRYAKKDVRTALVELAGKQVVYDVELKQAMAGR
jgi:hypothetical protein